MEQGYRIHDQPPARDNGSPTRAAGEARRSDSRAEMTASNQTQPADGLPASYAVDRRYLLRRMLLQFGFAALAVAGVTWIQVVAGLIPWAAFYLACATMAVFIAAAAPIRYFAWKQNCLTVTHTGLVLKTRRSPAVLPLTRNNPLIVRRSETGKYWQFTYAGWTGKPVEILFAAFPHLRRFIADLNVDTVVFEDTGGADRTSTAQTPRPEPRK